MFRFSWNLIWFKKAQLTLNFVFFLTFFISTNKSSERFNTTLHLYVNIKSNFFILILQNSFSFHQIYHQNLLFVNHWFYLIFLKTACQQMEFFADFTNFSLASQPACEIEEVSVENKQSVSYSTEEFSNSSQFFIFVTNFYQSFFIF